MNILQGDALDLIQAETGQFDLIVTDPPYSFSGSGDERAISATVAVVLRESALNPFAGSGVLVEAAEAYGMNAIGYEKNIPGGA